MARESPRSRASCSRAGTWQLPAPQLAIPDFTCFMGDATALSAESRRAAVISGCIVGFAYSANYTNHAPLAPALMREFGFNQALAGLLTTGIFTTHAAMQLPGGYLVDRLGSKRVLLFALVWVALGNLGMAFAAAYWQLFACKIFTGMGTR